MCQKWPKRHPKPRTRVPSFLHKNIPNSLDFFLEHGYQNTYSVAPPGRKSPSFLFLKSTAPPLKLNKNITWPGLRPDHLATTSKFMRSVCIACRWTWNSYARIKSPKVKRFIIHFHPIIFHPVIAKLQWSDSVLCSLILPPCRKRFRTQFLLNCYFYTMSVDNLILERNDFDWKTPWHRFFLHERPGIIKHGCRGK